MIFVDTNYFLRALVDPVTPRQQTMAATAATLMRRVQRGEEEITTSDAVIAEVAFVLGSKHNYGLPVEEIATRLKPLLNLSGFKLPNKRVCLRALDLWVTFPRLGFVDALGAAYAEVLRHSLASFDSDFDRVPGLTRWQPPPGSDTA